MQPEDGSNPRAAVLTTSRPSFRSLSALAALIWVISTSVLWSSHGVPLTWDEVDYVDAAKRGAWANMIEESSLTPAQFFRFVLAKFKKRTEAVPSSYDEERDNLRLRHYHPPLVVVMLSSLGDYGNERLVRSVQLAGALLLILAILWSYRSLSETPTRSGLLAVSVLAVWMTPMLFAALSFHGWQSVWVTASAALTSAWLRHQTRGLAVALGVCLALSLLTLETGLLVWAVCFLSMIVWRPRAGVSGKPGATRSQLATIILVSGVVVLLVWPGSIAKASLVKIPSLYLYRIALGQEYSDVSNRAGFLVRSLFPLLGPGGLACIGLLLFDRKEAKRWGPFCLMGGLYGAALARFALSPTYVLPALGPLACVVGYAVDRAGCLWQRLVMLGFVILAVAWAWPAAFSEQSARAVRADIRAVGERIQGREAFVDGKHIYQHYLGPNYAMRSITVQSDRVSVREAGSYRSLTKRDLVGKVVIIQRDRRFLENPACSSLFDGCSWRDLGTVRIYDCGGDAASHEGPAE